MFAFHEWPISRAAIFLGLEFLPTAAGQERYDGEVGKGGEGGWMGERKPCDELCVLLRAKGARHGHAA